MGDMHFRMSAYQVGDRASPRYVWGVGMPKELLESLPEEERRIKLSAEGDKFYVTFGTEGIPFHEPHANARTWWTSQIGLHHCTNIGVPDEVVRARRVDGKWQTGKNRIEVRKVPDFVRHAMEAATPEPHVDLDPPSRHFTEDVQHAVLENATGVSSFMHHEEVITEPTTATSKWFEEQVARGNIQPFAEVVNLTPELADHLLRHNANNRKIRTAKLNQYISDIDNGRWELNGEQIMISTDGFMNNGQHRCSAVMATGKAIQTFMAFGVSRESRRTVDTGANRGPQDHLSIEGYKNATALAGITRYVIAYERENKQTVTHTSRITSSEILDRVAADDKLVQAAAFAYSSAKIRRLASPSVFGFCYYEFRKIDEADAEAFMTQIISGIGLEAQSPAYVVREKLMEFSNMAREHKIEVLFRGWNAFRKKKPMRALRIMWELPQLI